jgi:hypothetical protein
MKILVPLKRKDQLKDVMPYVEKVATPGMEAIFLVPYPVDGLRWSTADLESQAVDEGRQLVEYYTWENNVRRATRRLSEAVERLSSRGIGVSVELYAGKLRATVKRYTDQGDVHLIVTGAGFGQRLAGLFNGGNSFLGLFKRPSLSPAVLIHPKMIG